MADFIPFGAMLYANKFDSLSLSPALVVVVVVVLLFFTLVYAHV